MHCLKNFKSDDFDTEENCTLTWQIEEVDSENTKRRQGQFPAWKASHRESVSSAMKQLSSKDNISDTEMEIVPVEKSLTSNQPYAGFYDSDSADSAHSGEVISSFKASLGHPYPEKDTRSKKVMGCTICSELGFCMPV